VLVLGTYRPAELNTGHHPMREARQELERYGVAHELAVIAHCGIGTARLKLGNASGAIASERAARALVSGDPDSLTESSEALQLFSARLAAAAADFRFLGATPDALRAERLLQEKRLPAVERYACRAPL